MFPPGVFTLQGAGASEEAVANVPCQVACTDQACRDTKPSCSVALSNWKINGTHVIRTGPEKNAGLAIAQLAPGLLDDPDVREKMFIMLENLELGTSAALVLGSSSNPEVRSRLENVAGGKEGRASHRASIAINSSYEKMEGTR